VECDANVRMSRKALRVLASFLENPTVTMLMRARRRATQLDWPNPALNSLLIEITGLPGRS